jgi:hypothetical protein
VSARDESAELAAVVAERGALPMPVVPEPQVLPSTGPICTQAEARAAGLDIAPSVEELDAMASSIAAVGDPLSAEVSLAQAVPLLGAAVTGLRARVAELEKREAVVAEFVAKRAEYITAIRNCHPDNGHDYDRWQGHAAARRQLAELLGLPVAWPVEAPASVVRAAEGEHYAAVHHSYRLGHDLPETGGEVRG